MDSPRNIVVCQDSLRYAKSLGDDTFDLTFGSPPYEDRRTYGIGFNLKGEDWVDWMKEHIREYVRITKGPVMMVVNGVQRKFEWSATPEKLVADLQREGLFVRKPIIWQNTGMPGSGGPDWFRNNYHTIVVASKVRRYPWSNQRAIGAPVKYPDGGAMNPRREDGHREKQNYPNMHKYDRVGPGCVWYHPTGGGMMGSKLAHENEAPFPESLARSAVMSLCPPEGIVYDPFGGSGTTAAAAIMARRSFVVTDIREEQCDLTLKRIEEAHDRLLTDLPYDEICANCISYRGSHVPYETTWWDGRCLYCGEETGVTAIRDMERNNETVQTQ